MRKTLYAITLALGASLGGVARAETVVQEGIAGGNNAPYDTQNILFNDPGKGDIASGQNFVRGHTNQTFDLVDFTSNEPLVVNSGGGGQANIFDAAKDGFDSLIIRYVDDTIGIQQLIIAVAATEPGGTIEFFTGSSYSGSTFVPGTSLGSFELNGVSNDLFKIYTTDVGETLSSLDFVVTGPQVSIIIDDVSQARIAGTVVPVPAAVWGGAALLGSLGLARRLRRE